jgi:hypothetical protein
VSPFHPVVSLADPQNVDAKVIDARQAGGRVQGHCRHGWRYTNETVSLLAARTRKPRKAVRDAKKAGYAYVVLDGTLIPIDQAPRIRTPPTRTGNWARSHREHLNRAQNPRLAAAPRLAAVIAKD